MKQAALLFASIFAMVTGFATIRTVSNLPATLAQFNTIQAAVNASASGDTIYVHGSPNAYSAFTITNKQLVVIGPGWSPNKNLPFTAVVSGLAITGASCANTEIQGLVINSTVSMNTNHPDNLRFVRNQFSGMTVQLFEFGVTYSGYLFESNVFDNAAFTATSGSNYQNFLFQNNYFYDNGCCVGGNVSGLVNAVNILFNHNLWFGPGSGVRDCFSGNCRFLTLTNNIFVRRDAGNQNSFSTFNNNITFYPSGSTAPSDPWTINSNVNSGGNISNQDPQMAAQTSVNGGTNNPLLDFSIASGPGNNSATDGKDIGLLFDPTGSLNWTNSRASRTPFIFSMNIVNPTIPQGGTLSVQVEARKNN